MFQANYLGISQGWAQAWVLFEAPQVWWAEQWPRKEDHVLIPRTCFLNVCYQKGIEAAGGIKIAN